MSKFIVVSYLQMPNGEPSQIMYHCSEPERISKHETAGGFCYYVGGAITHDDRASAQTTRNRIQKYYPTYHMHVKEFSNKEIFIGKLEGAPHER